MKRLNVVIGETDKGALKTLYLGRDAVKAKEVLQEAVKEGKLQEVAHFRQARPTMRKRPRKIAAALKAAAKEREEQARRAKEPDQEPDQEAAQEPAQEAEPAKG